MTEFEQARARLFEVSSAGGCSHPIRLFGETINVATGELNQQVLKVPCKDRRAVICPACSYLYKADAWILVATGLNGGKGVPESVAQHPRLFVTLTAPSFGPVHSSGSRSGRCRQRRERVVCEHGLPTWCNQRHDYCEHNGNEILGTPLCPDCFDYRGAVLWNARASQLWNRTITQLRRTIAKSNGLNERELPKVARLSYLKVAEIQRRGLLHFHAILRIDGPEGPETEPPEWLTVDLLERHIQEAIEWIKLSVEDGTEVSWGSQFDIQDVSAVTQDDRRIAAYLAKYASKTTDGSIELARQFNSRNEIESLRVSEHARQMALTAWDLGMELGLQDLRLRHHAHTFGFAGQLITKSRNYSTTFRSLRSARTTYRSKASSSDPIEGSFNFVGRGYDDPSAERLAEVLFVQGRELKRELKAAHMSSRSTSRPL